MEMPDEIVKTVYDSINQQPQTQRALNSQLQDLRQIANRLGLYDAADFLRDCLKK